MRMTNKVNASLSGKARSAFQWSASESEWIHPVSVQIQASASVGDR